MKIYIDLFIIGVLLSWGPCFSFCAPLTLPFIAATQKGWRQGLKLSLVFSLARIVPYVILSIISAILGQYLISNFYEGQAKTVIYFVVGAFISLLGIIILIGKSPYLHLCAPVKRIGPGGVKEMALLGLLVGFAPCLPLLGVLAYIAFHTQDFLQGALLGLTFGAGTLVSPLILCGSLAGGVSLILLKKPLVYKIFSRACGVILVYFGIDMIIRALRLLCG